MSLIKQVEVQWVHLQQPDTRYSPVWKADVHVTTAILETLNAEIKAFSEANDLPFKKLKAKLDDNDNKVITIKRNVDKAGGEENDQPVCVGTEKDELTGELVKIKALIGNGSICNVQYSLYKWGPNKYGKGVGIDFKGLQVLSLVEYGGATADGDEFGEVVEGDKPKAAPKPKAESDFDDEDFDDE